MSPFEIFCTKIYAYFEHININLCLQKAYESKCIYTTNPQTREKSNACMDFDKVDKWLLKLDIIIKLSYHRTVISIARKCVGICITWIILNPFSSLTFSLFFMDKIIIFL